MPLLGLARSLSAEGRCVAFDSLATNLVPGDTNHRQDVFVRDRLADLTIRMSVSSAGRQGNGDRATPSISADGRHVACASNVTNLAVGDTNGAVDVFASDESGDLRQRQTLSQLRRSPSYAACLGLGGQR